MAGPSPLSHRLDEADKAYQHILDIGDGMSPNATAIAGAMVLALHGALFAEAASYIRELERR